MGVDGSPLQTRGCVQITLKIAEVKFNSNFIVVDNLTAEGIRGLDVFKEHLCNIDIPNNCISFLQKNMKVPLQHREPQIKSQHSLFRLFTYHYNVKTKYQRIPRYLTAVINHGCWNIWPSKLNSIVIARPIVSPINGTFPVRLINLSDLPVALYEIGTLEDIDRIGIATVSADTAKKELLKKLTQEQYQIIKDLVNSSTAQLTLTQKESFLVKYSNIFVFKGNHQDIFQRFVTILTQETNLQFVHQRFPRLPLTFKEEVRTLFCGMLDKDIIKPSSSPRASLIILV